MKITKEDFEQMKAKYDSEVKTGKAGKDKKLKIQNQTESVSYTKEELMEVLGQERVTGIKFYFTEYTEKVAKQFYGDQADQYIGKLGLVFSPIYENENRSKSSESDGEYFDRGQVCPPACT